MDNKDKTTKKKDKILGIIDKIVSLASDGEYIYRGQPDVAYLHVSSSLYRAVVENYPEIRGADWLDMNLAQEETLKNARCFASADSNKGDTEMLSRIQHYSGNTNLIDFTKDYRVALFFACSQQGDDESGKDGKVFLLKKSNLQDSEKDSEIKMVTPEHPFNRVEAQKSVFVQSRTGIIPDGMMEFVEIPRDLKQSIMDYLRECYGISEHSIYNDLHGHIGNYKIHDNAVIEGYLGVNYCDKSDKAQLPEEKSDALKKAIEHFDKAILIAPNFVMAYYNRGIARQHLGDIAGAMSDYDKSIELNPDDADTYNNRGLAKRKLKDVSGAISDYDKAIALNPDNIIAYNNRGFAKLKLGDVPGAISDYDNAIALNSNDAMSYHNRGIVKRDAGDNKGAIKDFNVAIDLNPSFALAYLNRGMVFVYQQDFQQALIDFENAEKWALQQNNQDIVGAAQKAIKLITAKMPKL